MTRWIALIAMVFATAAHAEDDEILAAIRKEVNALAIEISEEEVPDLLIAALDASGGDVHDTLGLMLLREAGIEPELGMKRLAKRVAVHVVLKENLSPREVTIGFALRAYYGRKCYGWRAASAGLMAVEAEQADDIALITLAALTFSPSRFVKDEELRDARVRLTVENLSKTQTIADSRLEPLHSAASSDPNSGPGC